MGIVVPDITVIAAASAADAVALKVFDDGVSIGSSVAPVTIDIFNEPICPPCGSFIRANASDMDTAVNNKKLTVRYHLLNFLDSVSHSKNYSTRAVAATYCVAAQNDPKVYSDFYSGLFASNFQPAEHAPEDRADGELAQLAKSVGADTSVTDCIKSGNELGTAKTKAAAGYAQLNGLNAGATPFVWDGSKCVNYQDHDLADQATRVVREWSANSPGLPTATARTPSRRSPRHSGTARCCTFRAEIGGRLPSWSLTANIAAAVWRGGCRCCRGVVGSLLEGDGPHGGTPTADHSSKGSPHRM